MINPEHVDSLAQAAYGRFRAKYPEKPEWAALPEPTKITWRDDVCAADKVRDGSRSEVLQEQCVFEVVNEYWASGGLTSWKAAEEARPEPSQRPKTKRR
jgi:hypothetical protein